ncbi:uncharacterized protein LOC17877490 isoform X2 [Capsella rubella]|uniref:uncharacterized protein LOC17877490 isoform X2 n=1 Tax=Capsella rubella TaxID=81985 RepID=UPI000CD567FA|nr:uncharacterized protein LOC17877490 isoform X2 [Capsella rubella]
MDGRGGGGGVSNGNAGVPASSRKVVQSLKEIVNCSELEIYVMLVECDMDPDEAICRLLSQDTFHEVKSKREKKKKTKYPVDSWTRYNTSRGGRNKYNSNEMGNAQGVPANIREKGARNHCVGSSFSSGVLGLQPPSNSSKVKKAPTRSNDAVPSSSLPTHTSQSAWVSANPGKRTMADIVKMGRPQQQNNIDVPRSSKAQESRNKAHMKDEWPSIEKQDVSHQSSSVLKPAAESKMSANQFSESQHLDETLLDNRHQETTTYPIGSPPNADHDLPASVSSKNLVNGDSRDPSDCSDENNKVKSHLYEENGAEDVSTYVANGSHQLTIENEEALPKEDKPAVIFPNHIQIHKSKCSHIMFGSFGFGIGSCQVSGLNDNLDEPLETEDDSSFKHTDTDFSGEDEEQLRNDATNEQISNQIDPSTRDHHSATDSDKESVQHEPPQEEGDQYKFSSSTDYGFVNTQQLNPSSGTNPQIQNLDTFPSVMHQGYTSSSPNTLIPSSIQDAREFYLHYSPFPTKYNTAAPSSHVGPTISMELRAASISTQNAVPNAGQQEAALTQHLALNSFSHQPRMPLGHYSNLISYPFMTQSYNPYMPSGFQQALPTNNQQSLAAMLPQYKSQATAHHVPPPSVNGFGGSAASSNNFSLNPASAANSYEDVSSSQFKHINHLASPHQHKNENSAAWHQGKQPNLRVTMGNGYYSFPGHQNQHLHGFRQTQQLQQQHQLSQHQQQHFGGHGYVSPYHSQAAMSLDHLHYQHQQ